MSFIVRRKITGRPCGQVVGDDVIKRLSISHCIFSGVSFILILTAALHARLAAMSSRRVAFAPPRFSASTVSKISFKRFLTSLRRQIGRHGFDRHRSARKPHHAETETFQIVFDKRKCLTLRGRQDQSFRAAKDFATRSFVRFLFCETCRTKFVRARRAGQSKAFLHRQLR